jgi:hypothetical protein
MPWVGLEPTTPASDRAKTVHALDGPATVIAKYNLTANKFIEIYIIVQRKHIHFFKTGWSGGIGDCKRWFMFILKTERQRFELSRYEYFPS